MYVSDLVSVIIPTRNAVELTLEAVESALAQSYDNVEILVVDDGSDLENRRNLARALEKLGDTRVEYHPFDENQGVAAARSFGIKGSKGQYIAFLDCDDLWMPQKLTKQLEFMDEKNAAFSFTTYLNRDEKKGVVHERVPPEVVTYRKLLTGNVIGNSTVVLDRRKLQLPQIPELRRRQDYAFWLAILKSGVVGYGLGQALTTRRLVSGSLSSNKFIAVRDTWKMFRQLPDVSFLRATTLFLHYLFNGVGDRVRRTKPKSIAVQRERQKGT